MDTYRSWVNQVDLVSVANILQMLHPVRWTLGVEMDNLLLTPTHPSHIGVRACELGAETPHLAVRRNGPWAQTPTTPFPFLLPE